MSRTFKIAVVLFPGTNCEDEAARAVRAAGMDAEIVRWNMPIRRGQYDGFILPGGWSYEDRIRAGAVAAHDDIMDIVRQEAASGRPVLGICNGAQVLAETGLVPGRTTAVEVALAPNERGYRCAWVHVRLDGYPTATAFTGAYQAGEVLPIPVAHGEGRYLTANDDASWLDHFTTFRYCLPDGSDATDFPENPNGSLRTIAALRNEQGNVLAIMPHPERASWWHQFPPHRRPERRDMPPPAHRMFTSMRAYLERGA